MNHFLRFSLSFVNLSHLVMKDSLGFLLCKILTQTTDAGRSGAHPGASEPTVRPELIRLAESIFWLWNHVRVQILFVLIPTHEV